MSLEDLIIPTKLKITIDTNIHGLNNYEYKPINSVPGFTRMSTGAISDAIFFNPLVKLREGVIKDVPREFQITQFFDMLQFQTLMDLHENNAQFPNIGFLSNIRQNLTGAFEEEAESLVEQHRRDAVKKSDLLLRATLDGVIDSNIALMLDLFFPQGANFTVGGNKIFTIVDMSWTRGNWIVEPIRVPTTLLSEKYYDLSLNMYDINSFNPVLLYFINYARMPENMTASQKIAAIIQHMPDILRKGVVFSSIENRARRLEERRKYMREVRKYMRRVPGHIREEVKKAPGAVYEGAIKTGEVLGDMAERVAPYVLPKALRGKPYVVEDAFERAVRDEDRAAAATKKAPQRSLLDKIRGEKIRIDPRKQFEGGPEEVGREMGPNAMEMQDYGKTRLQPVRREDLLDVRAPNNENPEAILKYLAPTQTPAPSALELRDVNRQERFENELLEQRRPPQKQPNPFVVNPERINEEDNKGRELVRFKGGADTKTNVAAAAPTKPSETVAVAAAPTKPNNDINLFEYHYKLRKELEELEKKYSKQKLEQDAKIYEACYHVRVHLDLYYGKSLPPEYMNYAVCNKKWNAVRKSFAEFTGQRYIKKPYHTMRVKPAPVATKPTAATPVKGGNGHIKESSNLFSGRHTRRRQRPTVQDISAVLKQYG